MGRREPGIYGSLDFDGLRAALSERAASLGVELEQRQSNHEGVLVDWVQEAMGAFDGVLINPGAYTHTSIALRDAFAEIAMQRGALSFPQLQVLQETDPEAFIARAREVRNDGAWIDSGENDSSIINTLLRNEDSIGVLGYSFLEQNLDRIKAASIGGVAPTFETITSGEYGVSRSMYFYVKVENGMFVPGLADFVAEFTQEDAWGPDGYLVDKGLIPLLADERTTVRDHALAVLTGSKSPLPSANDPSIQQTVEGLPD